MAVVHPKDKAEFDKIIEGEKPVLVDFFAQWCGPCQMMGPIFDDLAKDYKNADKVEIMKVDVDQLQDVASDLAIMSVPTFIIFKDGKVIETMTGMRSQSDLEAKLDAQLK